MTTLVLHAGAELVDRGAVIRELSRHRAELAAAGVVLPPGADPGAWRRSTTELLRRDPAAVARLVEAKSSGAEIVLFSSDTAGDTLAVPDEAARLADLGAEQG